jgi:endonuclease/exonuclease/phosphatase family metal-dependent hydrolase
LKWNRFRQGGGAQQFIPEDIEAQQGYGVCVREAGQLRRLWVDQANPNVDADRPTAQAHYDLCFEAIHTTTGSYLGNRDTEPRLVVLGRLKLPDGAGMRYANVLNLHLTTLRGEREGNIRLDRRGSRTRLQQLDLILDNIISAYQEAKEHRLPRTAPNQKEDIWIMAGDFNATQDSEELELVRRVGFVDGNLDKSLEDATGTFQDQIGTKWSLSRPTAPPTATDYILCGLRSNAFPEKGVSVTHSRRPYRPLFPQGSPFEPDHAVLFASLDIR